MASATGAYESTPTCVDIVSVLYALEQIGMPLGILGTVCRILPLYSIGLGWVLVAVLAFLASMVFGSEKERSKKKRETAIEG